MSPPMTIRDQALLGAAIPSGGIAGNTRAVQNGGYGSSGGTSLMEYFQIHTLSDGATFGEATEGGGTFSCAGGSGTNYRCAGTGNDTRGPTANSFPLSVRTPNRKLTLGLNLF